MKNSKTLNPLKSELDAILNLDSFLNNKKNIKKKTSIFTVVKGIVFNFEETMLEIQTLFKALQINSNNNKEIQLKKSKLNVVA